MIGHGEPRVFVANLAFKSSTAVVSLSMMGLGTAGNLEAQISAISEDERSST